MKMTKIAASAVIAATLPVVASAATVLTDGEVYNLADDNEFFYTARTDEADAADNSFTFGFNSGGNPGATSFSSTLDGINTDISMLTVIWSSEANGGGTVYATESMALSGGSATIANFSTSFAVGDPQWFSVQWDGDDNNALVNVEVGAVPVPAAGFLLLGGLGAFAAMKRRKKA